MSISWIHLSDIHFGQGRGVHPNLDRGLVLEQLLDDVGLVRGVLGSPDSVFVTGDLAYSGKRGEFDKASEWLKKLANRLEIDLSQVLLVPGNHDINRTAVQGAVVGATHSQMRIDHEFLSNLLEQEEAGAIWAKFDEYQSFAAGGFGAPGITALNPHWGLDLRTGQAAVYAVGLNSALQCYDDDDRGNLRLSLWQIERALNDCPNDALIIVLLHHPPEHLKDGRELLDRLQKHTFVLLCGDVHTQEASELLPLGKHGHLRFVAAAVHSTSEKSTHAYAWVFLNQEGLQYYPRQWSREGKKFLGPHLDLRSPGVRVDPDLGFFISRSPQDLGEPLGSWVNRAGAQELFHSPGSVATVSPQESRGPGVGFFAPQPFRSKIINSAIMRRAASRLCSLVSRYDRYEPDVLIAMNEGGLVVTAAIMQNWYRSETTVGSVFCIKRSGEPYEIKFISLPGKIGKIDETAEIDETVWNQVQPSRILVVDTKIKSGKSAGLVYELLRQTYGDKVKIRFALVLAYAGWPGQWSPQEDPFPWPAHFSKDDRISAYIAYYTDKDPDKDGIEEEFRPGWKWEDDEL